MDCQRKINKRFLKGFQKENKKNLEECLKN